MNLQAGEKTWVYARVDGDAASGGVALVALHTGPQPEAVEVPVEAIGLADGTRLRERLGSGASATVEGGPGPARPSPPGSSVVFTP